MLDTGENLEVVGGVVGGDAVFVVNVDVGASCWHGRVEVTPHVQSQLDGALKRERAGAFREDEVGPVGSEWNG